MVYNTPVDEILLALPDGSEIVRPHQSEPFCRRGFHPQDLIIYGLNKGFATTQLDRETSLTDGSDAIYHNALNLQEFCIGRIGVLAGYGKKTPHAVAWDGKKIFDPNGTIYSISEFKIISFYLINLISTD